MTMASTTEDQLYRIFLAISEEPRPQQQNTSAMLEDVIAQLDEVRSSIPTPAPANKTQTTTAAKSQDSSSSVIGTVASSILKSGFGVAPLIGGLVSLFGGGGDVEQPAPLVKYALPRSIDFQAAESNSRVTGLDYGQMGLARGYAAAGVGGSQNISASAATPQITVNVQAMDARSFLDRSNDIALAVRDAMLNLHSINDVVNEL